MLYTFKNYRKNRRLVQYFFKMKKQQEAKIAQKAE